MYQSVLVDGHHRIVVWRALVETLVGAVVVEVAEVVVEDKRRVLVL